MKESYHGSILIVDDDPGVLDSTSLLLQEFGFSTLSCSDAGDAIERLQRVRIDAVLTDIKMPRISGIELLEEIHNIAGELPVIMMTAYADLDTAIDALKKGAYDFIVKPYRADQLLHAIEKAVKYSRLIQVEMEYKDILTEFNLELETLGAEKTMNLMALALADKVRNPASVIGGLCRRILEKEELSEGAESKMKLLLEEAARLEAAVRDFEASLESRRSMFVYEDINGIIEGVATVVRRETDYKGVELAVYLPEESIKINLHKNLFRIAIFHLIRNAIEATPVGGRIALSLTKDENSVIIIITDTGPGIPPGIAGKIFDQLYSTKKHHFGIGLPLIKQIVTEHLGEISVESEVGKGSAFTISLPLRWKEGMAN